ncbi:MAG: hypothetical protein DRP08_07650, partial [Candidatus Aenigmatarchaeota archaeon]
RLRLALTFIVALMLLLALTLPKETYASSIEISNLKIRLCSLTKCSREITIFPGENITIYYEFKVKGQGPLYLIWFIYLIDPTGFVVPLHRDSMGNGSVQGVDFIFHGKFSFSSNYYVVNGAYLVVLKVLNRPTGVQKSAYSVFIVENGIEKEAVLLVRQVIKLKNMRGSPSKVNLYVILPYNSSPFQIVLPDTEFSVKPKGVFYDKYGNRYAYFENINVPSRGSTRVEIKSVVKVNTFYYPSVRVDLDWLNDIPENLRKYLEPSFAIESDHPDIISVAEEIKSNVSDVLALYKSIANFTSRYLKYEAVSEEKSALWALHNRRGDCTQFSRLYVALARATGAPSRMIIGYVLSYREPYVFEGSEHAWAEVFIPSYGWIPVEPQFNGFFIGHTLPYVKLMVEPGNEIVVNNQTFKVGEFYYIYYGGKVEAESYFYFKTYPPPNHSVSVELERDKVMAGENITCIVKTNAESVLLSVKGPSGYVMYIDAKPGVVSFNIPAKKELIGLWNITPLYPLGETRYFNVYGYNSSLEIMLLPSQNSVEKLAGKISPPMVYGNVTLMIYNSSNVLVKKLCVYTNSSGVFQVNLKRFPEGNYTIFVEYSAFEYNNKVYAGLKKSFHIRILRQRGISIEYMKLEEYAYLIIIILIIVLVTLVTIKLIKKKS